MPKQSRSNSSRPSWMQGREWILTVVPGGLLIIAAFAFTLRFVEPGPPKVVKISTGGENGAYYAFGKRYADILARSGVKLEVMSSAGSVENLARLRDPGTGVGIALLQGGIGSSKVAPGVSSVGRVFHEPLWIFYRGEPIDRLSQLKGKRIAVGADGSGNRVLAAALLEANDVTEATATLSPLSSQPAVDALNAGQIDAVFLALAPQAPLVQTLLRSPDIKLMSVTQADAYSKIFPFLAKLTLPQGVIDLVANIPARDVTLMAPTAALVVREDVHPAIVALLAEAAQEVHGKMSLFSKAGEFPSLNDPDFDMDQDAVRFYKSGPTFWKRFLPFWLANMAERMVVFLVPLLTILFPLSKALPAIYRWRIRQRLLARYKQMKDIELRLAELPQGANPSALLSETDALSETVARMPVPIQFSEQFYDLRDHLDQVRARLAARGAGATA